jgi:hypothetical protein
MKRANSNAEQRTPNIQWADKLIAAKPQRGEAQASDFVG